jgi:hypothetical protein
MRLSFEYRKRICNLAFIALLGLFLVYSGKTVFAHSLGQSYIFIKRFDNQLSGRFEITLRDLNKALTATSTREPITVANLKDRIDEVYDYYIKNIRFYDGSRKLPFRFTGSGIMKAKFATYVQLDFNIFENSAGPDVIDIDYEVMFDADPDHLALLVIEQFWKGGIYSNESRISLAFSPSDRRQQLSFSDYSVYKGFTGVVKLGIEHIWKGIDHILFLTALILPSAMRRNERNWEPVSEFRSAIINLVKIVTLFTVAHSVTLSIAALGVFNLSSRLVEPVIAVSIAVAALDIIFPIFKGKIGWVVLIFGLFHGLGFASVLVKRGVLGEHMALSLFGFNLGVEIGQIAVICIIFPAIYFFRRYTFYPKIILRYGAMTMIFLSAIWFVDRTFLDNPLQRLFANMLADVIK